MSSSFGLSLGLEVDGSLLSGGTAPLSGGPEISGTLLHSQGISWKNGSDFVLAYRVRRVKVSKDGIVTHERYTKGAMLENEDDEEVEARIPRLKVLVDMCDLGLEDNKFEAAEYMEGDDPVCCVARAAGVN